MSNQTAGDGARVRGWTSATVPADTGITINVRFNPDGSVNQISQLPTGLAPQDWFAKLVAGGTSFQALSGGRGVFRLGTEALNSLQQG